MSMSSNFFDKAYVQALKTLEDQQRLKLIRKFWILPSTSMDEFDEFASKAFLNYVADQLESVRHHRDLFAVQDFDGTFAIIQKLRANLPKPCEEFLDELSSGYLNVSREAIRRSVELSTRLWLTLDTCSADIRVGPESSAKDPIDGDLRLSLEQVVRNQFTSRTMSHGQDEASRFDARFTAAYLVNTCSMKLQWSDDIATHLNFDSKNLVLLVYRHKACLRSHLESHHGCPIPKDVLEELLDTLDLLFPLGDVATKHLLFKEGQQSLYTLGVRETKEDLDLTRYKYFGAKLGRLMKSFDKNSTTWRQLALDRRNKLEWSAFWVTVIMVALLTVISIPCNIIQATYSVKAYHATLAQEASSQSKKL